MTALVVGYGNRLRGDDGAGPWVAERLMETVSVDVHVLAAHQLTPEMAAKFIAVSTVIFVDACLAKSGDRVRATRVEPATTANPLGHAVDPGALMALAQALFGA